MQPIKIRFEITIEIDFSVEEKISNLYYIIRGAYTPEDLYSSLKKIRYKSRLEFDYEYSQSHGILPNFQDITKTGKCSFTIITKPFECIYIDGNSTIIIDEIKNVNPAINGLSEIIVDAKSRLGEGESISRILLVEKQTSST